MRAVKHSVRQLPRGAPKQAAQTKDGQGQGRQRKGSNVKAPVIRSTAAPVQTATVMRSTAAPVLKATVITTTAAAVPLVDTCAGRCVPRCCPAAVARTTGCGWWCVCGCAHTCLPWDASAKASCAEKVLFPTPPFPDSTRILCLMPFMRSSMATRSGSGPLGAEAQAAWLGHPSQAAAWPACSAPVPGQSALQRQAAGGYHARKCSYGGSAMS